MTTTGLSRRIAERVGDAGFLPAERCPQGHWLDDLDDLPDDVCGEPPEVGEICPACRSEWMFAQRCADREDFARSDFDAHVNGPAWHPEWRVGRGEPKPYAESLDLLVPLVEAWCRERDAIWVLASPKTDAGWWDARVFLHRNDDSRDTLEFGKTASEALAEAFLAAVEQEEAHNGDHV